MPVKEELTHSFYHPNKSLLLEINDCFNSKVWAQIKQIELIFTHLKLWVAVARHNLKWVKI